MRRQFAASLTGLLLVPGMLCAQASAYLPDRGEAGFSPFYIFQTYDRFWLGSDSEDFPRTDQHTAGATIEYGLFDDIALDVSISYARSIGTRKDVFNNDKVVGVEDGLNDTNIGARWRAFDEYEWDSPLVPTVTLRLGGIIQGKYESNTPEAIGDNASGVEGSIIWSKVFGATGFGISGEAGLRYRAEHVPDDFFVSAGLFQTFFDCLTLSCNFRHIHAMSGPDIGDPGFTFPEVKEISSSLEYGIAYHDEGSRFYQFYVGHTIDGRNTSERLVFGFSVGIPFGGPEYSLQDLLHGPGDDDEP